jgi:hypothetical protein
MERKYRGIKSETRALQICFWPYSNEKELKRDFGGWGRGERWLAGDHILRSVTQRSLHSHYPFISITLEHISFMRFRLRPELCK